MADRSVAAVAILALGLAAGGLLIGQRFARGRSTERFVTAQYALD